MFRKLKVDNFKSLVDFSVEFTPMSVIIGNNATGKSSDPSDCRSRAGSPRCRRRGPAAPPPPPGRR